MLVSKMNLSRFGSYHACFSVNFGCLSAFVPMCQVDLLCLPVLEWWLYAISVLWGSVASWSPECSRNAPFWGYMNLHSVVKFWLLACPWVGLPLASQTSRVDTDCNVWSAMWGLTPGNGIHFSSVWCLQRSLFVYANCGASWFMLWCGLCTATFCFGSGFSWEGLWARSLLAFACDRPWPYSSKQAWSYKVMAAKFVAISAGPEYACEGAKLHTNTGFHQNWVLGKASQKTQGCLRSASVC